MTVLLVGLLGFVNISWWGSPESLREAIRTGTADIPLIYIRNVQQVFHMVMLQTFDCKKDMSLLCAMFHVLLRHQTRYHHMKLADFSLYTIEIRSGLSVFPLPGPP